MDPAGLVRRGALHVHLCTARVRPGICRAGERASDDQFTTTVGNDDDDPPEQDDHDAPSDDDDACPDDEHVVDEHDNFVIDYDDESGYHFLVDVLHVHDRSGLGHAPRGRDDPLFGLEHAIEPVARPGVADGYQPEVIRRVRRERRDRRRCRHGR